MATNAQSNNKNNHLKRIELWHKKDIRIKKPSSEHLLRAIPKTTVDDLSMPHVCFAIIPRNQLNYVVTECGNWEIVERNYRKVDWFRYHHVRTNFDTFSREKISFTSVKQSEKRYHDVLISNDKKKSNIYSDVRKKNSMLHVI